MMNDEMEQFEERLRRQPVKKIPDEWRMEILSSAASAPRPAPGAPLLSTLNQKLSALLWPHPAAWAGLAAVWIFIFALHFSMSYTSPVVAKQTSPPSPEMIAELKQQQRLFAELIGANEARVADRQKIISPRPRSERAEILMT